MSTEAVVTTESVCYVHCNFCNTILAVSVPCNDMFSIVTVRCGHCTNLLSVNMRALLQTLPVQDRQANTTRLVDDDMRYGTIPMINRIPFLSPSTFDQQRMLPIRSPRKKQRVPSAYNRFIKEEIQRIKASNPDISHREAFSAAAKNWAHFPHIHFGLNMEGNDQLKVNEVATAEGTGKIPGF